MKKLVKIISLFPVLILVISISLLSCSSDPFNPFNTGGGGGGKKKSTINGNVADVMDGSGVAGIKVIAIRGGKNVGKDTTDSEGNFKLKVQSGNITLRFETSSFSPVARVFPVTIDSEVTLVVDLAPNQITVEDWQISQDPIRCAGSDTFILPLDTGIVGFTIDGKGNDCIRANGDCIVEIVAQNITLTNCNNGVLAEDSGDVTLGGDTVPISVDAKNNGIDTKGDSSVTLTGTDIFITSTQGNGILATGSSIVEVDPSGDCTIEGDIVEQDNAMVDSGSCTFLP